MILVIGVYAVSYTHLDVYKRQIQPWFVEYSRPIVFGEDRLRVRGSLPVTFYVLTREMCIRDRLKTYPIYTDLYRTQIIYPSKQKHTRSTTASQLLLNIAYKQQLKIVNT